MVFLLFLLLTSIAADTVPYSAKTIKNAGSGFVEIIGPGKIQINGEVFPYEKTIYISVWNIDSISTINEKKKGCMLHYSSEGYTQNISIINQSSKEVIKIIGEARK